MAGDAADDLYGLPLDAFVPERDALAKRLRADNRREDAAAVRALRKPSVAAWAANQVLRSQPSKARELPAGAGGGDRGGRRLRRVRRPAHGRRGAGGPP